MKHFLSLVLTSLFFALPANAQISVNSVIVHFKFGDRPVQNLIVHNSSPQVLYVTVTAEEYLDPGIENSEVKPTDAVLVSPKRFSVDATNERVIRLLSKGGAADREHVYRVAFVPQDRGFADTVEKQHQGRQTVLRVLTGMGVLVFVDPANPKGILKWERLSNKVRFWNEGNRHVRIIDGKACDKEGKVCDPLPPKRIYAGKEFVIDAPDSKAVTYTKRDGPSGEYETIVIPAKE